MSCQECDDFRGIALPQYASFTDVHNVPWVMACRDATETRLLLAMLTGENGRMFVIVNEFLQDGDKTWNAANATSVTSKRFTGEWAK